MLQSIYRVPKKLRRARYGTNYLTSFPKAYEVQAQSNNFKKRSSNGNNCLFTNPGLIYIIVVVLIINNIGKFEI